MYQTQRALLLSRVGRYEEAAVEAEKAVVLGGNDAAALAGLAVAVEQHLADAREIARLHHAVGGQHRAHWPHAGVLEVGGRGPLAVAIALRVGARRDKSDLHWLLLAVLAPAVAADAVNGEQKISRLEGGFSIGARQGLGVTFSSP